VHPLAQGSFSFFPGEGVPSFRRRKRGGKTRAKNEIQPPNQPPHLFCPKEKKKLAQWGSSEKKAFSPQPLRLKKKRKKLKPIGNWVKKNGGFIFSLKPC